MYHKLLLKIFPPIINMVFFLKTCHAKHISKSIKLSFIAIIQYVGGTKRCEPTLERAKEMSIPVFIQDFIYSCQGQRWWPQSILPLFLNLSADFWEVEAKDLYLAPKMSHRQGWKMPENYSISTTQIHRLI